MKFIRALGGNAQAWDPLQDNVELLLSTAVCGKSDVEFPDLGHARALALRALLRCDRDNARAISLLQEWAAYECAWSRAQGGDRDAK